MSKHINGKGASAQNLNALNAIGVKPAFNISDISTLPSLGNDPAIAAGLAIQFGRACYANGSVVPDCVRELLCHHVLEGDLACEIVLAWFFGKGLLVDFAVASNDEFELHHD